MQNVGGVGKISMKIIMCGGVVVWQFAGYLTYQCSGGRHIEQAVKEQIYQYNGKITRDLMGWDHVGGTSCVIVLSMWSVSSANCYFS
jgi:hypothetical protein